MHVLLDGRGILDELDGIGRYSLNLINEIVRLAEGNTFEILIRRDLSSAMRERLPGHVKLHEVAYRHISPRTVFSLGRMIDRIAPDVYHSMFMFQPIFMHTRGIITLHDTMWLAHPSLQAAGRPWGMAGGWFYHRALMVPVLRKTSLIVAVSEATKRDIERCWPRLLSKVRVVSEGADGLFCINTDRVPAGERLDRLGLRPRKFMLHISNGRPYKNTPALIQAFARVANELGLSLVIIGRRSAFSSTITRAMKDFDLEDRVSYLGSVVDEDVAALMRGAVALVFPSLYEGFGLPVVEAMACGCPVLTSGRGALSEVAGDAALLVDPTSIDSMAQGIRKLATDAALRETLKQRGIKRSSRFTWSAAAERIIQIYREFDKQ